MVIVRMRHYDIIKFIYTKVFGRWNYNTFSHIFFPKCQSSVNKHRFLISKFDNRRITLPYIKNYYF